jgi:acyl-CoA synthetase (AMP-forming)/AMP-acid ligase II
MSSDPPGLVDSPDKREWVMERRLSDPPRRGPHGVILAQASTSAWIARAAGGRHPPEQAPTTAEKGRSGTGPGAAVRRQCRAAAWPDPQWGEAVAAAIVLRDGATLDAAGVVAYLRQHLAGYKKPRHVCFLPELPRTAASQQVPKPLLRELVPQRIAPQAPR